MKILLKISFVGSSYCGYQVQKDCPTIQGKLNEAAEALFGFECDVVGCSRTDSGVHADMFCLTLNKKGESGMTSTIPEESIPFAFNSYLPNDICVFEARYVDEDFHPRYDVKSKEYIYKILNSPIPDPFLSGRAWHYPKALSDADIENMNIAAERFIGKHDFCAFMASGSSVKDTEREVFSAKVWKEKNIIYFSVSADGFLYNMVRIMTGTLIAVGEGKISSDDVPRIIESRDRSRAGVTAPPDGLYLHKVVY